MSRYKIPKKLTNDQHAQFLSLPLLLQVVVIKTVHLKRCLEELSN